MFTNDLILPTNQYRYHASKLLVHYGCRLLNLKHLECIGTGSTTSAQRFWDHFDMVNPQINLTGREPKGV